MKIETDYIAKEVINRMELALDYDWISGTRKIVPRLWHWLFFLPRFKASETGSDGHQKTGGFIPKVEGHDRRMWAGSRLWFYDELYSSRYAKKESKIVNLTEKDGRSGKLVFILVRHEYYQDNRHILSEEQDIVYKPPPESDFTVADVNSMLSPPHYTAQWSEIIEPNPIMLFKYSALTYNSHRIHYDREYCKNIFGFPGLVVQGPLIATLLIELIRKKIPGAKVLEYSFRIKAPIFDFQEFKIEGFHKDDFVYLWAINDSGLETFSALAKIALF